MSQSSFDATDRYLFSLAQIQHLMRVEFNRAQRYRYPISCMLMSVDRLGHLRDLYGYDSKEEILEAAISLLKAETRSSDFLGRLADDRLLAVVPHTGQVGGRILSARLLDGIRKIDFQCDGRTIPITMSVGLAYDDDGDSLFFDSMLELAEEALADANEAGGGRFVVRGPGEISAS
ncbi:MAG: diguanylate cyclase (GGDEF)-like protein [Planctomycetota bacterium]|jgi:diguanylate cyclase (GGDEF)-like protein